MFLSSNHVKFNDFKVIFTVVLKPPKIKVIKKTMIIHQMFTITSRIKNLKIFILLHFFVMIEEKRHFLRKTLYILYLLYI